MKKKTVFTGVGTALITPFKDDKVDDAALLRLIDYQLSGNVDALVVTGTSGEASVLSAEEHYRVIAESVERTAGRVPVVAGSGSNDTRHAIERTKAACKAGADAVLLVTPYYNKTTQQGLVAHFRALADASEKPCILYNVPSRTGMNMLPETLQELSEHPNIVGLKEACGNLSQVAVERVLCGDNLDIYSGNDDQTVPLMSLGGKGVISVISNILPAAMKQLCDACLQLRYDEAAKLQLRLVPLMNQLMIETNPIPAKAACAALKLCENELRLPLVPMSEKNEQKLLELMRAEGLAI